MKNGSITEEPIEYLSNNKQVAKVVDGKLMAIAAGEAEIEIHLKNYPSIKQTITIAVIAEESNFSAYIEGNDTIRLDRKCEYSLKATDELTQDIYFTLDTTEYATIIDVQGNKCIIKANAKNKLGTFILSAEYNHNIYTKEISVIPLW